MGSASLCEGCGAVLPLADMEGKVVCPACGRATKEQKAPPAAGAPGSITIDFTGLGKAVEDAAKIGTSFPSYPTAKTVKRGIAFSSAVGCLVPLIVLAVTGAIAFSAFRNGTDTIKKSFGITSPGLSPSSGTSLQLPAEGGGVGDVIALGYDPKANERRVGRFRVAGEDSKVVWQTGPMGSSVYSVSLARAGANVFVAGGDSLRMVDLATGTQRWEASLPDKVSPSCAECFVAVGDGVVVRTDDATVAAYGPGSAEPRWSRHLAAANGTMVVTEAGVVVVDDAPAPARGQVATVLEAATGKVRSSYAPRCPGTEATSPFGGLSSGDLLRGVPGTSDLLAVVTFGSTCVVRWDGATGAVRWASPFELPGSVQKDDTVVSAQLLAFGTTANEVRRVDLATGQVGSLALPADVSARPLRVSGSMLVGETTSTRGSTKGGLVGWDLRTGAVAWQVPMPSGSQSVSRSVNGSDALFDGQPRSVLVATDTGLALVTFDGADRTYVVRTLDAATGKLSGGTPASFGSGSGTPSLEVEGVVANRLFAFLDSDLVVIPLDGKGSVSRFDD